MRTLPIALTAALVLAGLSVVITLFVEGGRDADPAGGRGAPGTASSGEQGTPQQVGPRLQHLPDGVPSEQAPAGTRTADTPASSELIPRSFTLRVRLVTTCPLTGLVRAKLSRADGSWSESDWLDGDSFSWEGLAHGRYRFEVDPTSWSVEGQDVEFGIDDEELERVLELPAHPLHGVSGVVVEASTGRPLERVSLMVNMRRAPRPGEPQAMLMPVLQEVECTDGAFCLGGLWVPPEAAQIRVVADAEGYRSSATPWLPLSDPASGHGLVFELEHPAQVTGFVRSVRQPEGIPGAQVLFLTGPAQATIIWNGWLQAAHGTPSDGTSALAKSGENGRFSMTVGAHRDGVLHVWHPEYPLWTSEPLVTGAEGERVDVIADLLPGGTIRGTVDEALWESKSGPVMVDLEALHANAGGPLSRMIPVEMAGDESGRFTFAGLEAGTYSVALRRVVSGDTPGFAYEWFDGRTVVLPEGADIEVHFEELTVPGSVTGRVLADGDDKIGSSSVRLIDEQGAQLSPEVPVDEVGSFRIDGLRPGEAIFLAGSSGRGKHLAIGARRVTILESADQDVGEVDLSRPVLHLHAGSDPGDAWQLRINSGDAVLDRALNRSVFRGRITLDEELWLHGLPAGTYQLIRNGESSSSAEFTLGAGQPAVQELRLP